MVCYCWCDKIRHLRHHRLRCHFCEITQKLCIILIAEYTSRHKQVSKVMGCRTKPIDTTNFQCVFLFVFFNKILCHQNNIIM